MKNIALLTTLLATVSFGQTVYDLPFASSGNGIELAVANASNVEATDVTIRVQSAPNWLAFVQRQYIISEIGAGEERAVLFSFAIEKSAPVGTEETLRFAISNSKGENWTKEIRISVAAPEVFELFQNYPNPFNPTTAIAYQLPKTSHVTLKVFNLLGQEVATLVNGEQPAGYYQSVWDAGREATGMYIYQLEAQAIDGQVMRSRRTTLLIK